MLHLGDLAAVSKCPLGELPLLRLTGRPNRQSLVLFREGLFDLDEIGEITEIAHNGNLKPADDG